MMTTYQDPIKVFLSYAREDESLLRELETHLSSLKRQGLISTWYDRKIVAGANWANVIDQHLEQASLILLLVSADFLASDYCYQVEMKYAIARHEAGEAHVVPIVIRPCDWSHTPFAIFQCLPRDGKAITTWHDRDLAWNDVTRSIRQVIEDQHLGQDLAQPPQEVKSRNKALFTDQFSTTPGSHPMGSYQQQYRMPILPSLRRVSRQTKLTLALFLFLLLGLGAFSVFHVVSNLSQSQSSNPYEGEMQHLILHDSLQANSQEAQWDEGGAITSSGKCQFVHGAYQLLALPLSEGLACYAEAPKLVLTDFTYEAGLTFVDGNAAGLIFRSQEGYPAKEYRFTIQTDGMYRLLVTTDGQQLTLRQGSSDAIHRDQTNVLAVVADKTSIRLYVNHQMLSQVHDSTYTEGRIGFYTPESSTDQNIPAAQVSNVIIWSR
jgi:hypothetical protein